jgi:Ca2+-binding RTX toxin-like protein
VATINGTANDDVLTGTQFNDNLYGLEGNDILDGGVGNDNMQGGSGNDTYYVDDYNDSIFEGIDGGVDSVYTNLSSYILAANVERVFGSTAANVQRSFWGNALDNYLEGADANDLLRGGAGIDTMVGGKGDDDYEVYETGDIIVEKAGEGDDRVQVYATAYTLPANVERMIYLGSAASGFAGTGNGLANEINGSAGNDVLVGGAGADKLLGGYGDDVYDIDNVGDLIIEAGQGTDRVNTSLLVYTLLADIEQLVFNGTGNFTGNGNSMDNLLEGGSGNDKLIGNGGADTMKGKAGDDMYLVEEAGDVVIETANEGRDVVVTTLAAYTLPIFVENLIYDGVYENAFQGTGNSLNNRIYGSGGNDYLDGKAGADQMDGGDGDDVYVVDDLGDDIWEVAGYGTDLVLASTAYWKMDEEIEKLVFLETSGTGHHGVGSWQDNEITGASGDDILDGGEGKDKLTGLAGNDTYVVDDTGDVIVEAAGGGTDTVRVVSLTTWTLTANLERLVYDGTAAFQAFGDASGNELITGSGNDFLNGQAGADRMEGRGGNDSYVVDDAGDQVVEAANGGADSVWTTLSAYTLAANVEALVYGGEYGAAFSATGNALDNYIEAGEGADYLDGGAGADTMYGRTGNDTYVVDNAGDIVREFQVGGTDEVRTALGSRSDFAAMYILPENVENLTGTSATAQGVYGNALDNLIRMGAGGDLIVLHDGGTDVVQSGGGDDFIYWGNSFTNSDSNDGGAGFDTVGLLGHYAIRFGADDLVGIEKLAVYSSGMFSPNTYDIAMDDANVGAGKTLIVVGLSLSAQEKLTFDGSAETDGSFNVRGGKGGDAIGGGAKADQLYGNLGADQLWGGAGKDIFEYYAANESNYAARDHILDFALGDKIALRDIDADGNAANGNSKFAFIGNQAFGAVAGQLRAVDLGDQWLIEGDVNGDSIADLQILVTTASADHLIAATDFYL